MPKIVIPEIITPWADFVAAAPQVSALFQRRHQACGNLCMIATIRRDGSPRISPMEPRIFEGQLLLVGMPGTTKFGDLERDPRFSLHTATIDNRVTDGDAKLSGRVVALEDAEYRRRFLAHLLAESDMDFEDDQVSPLYAADITSASTVEVVNEEHLELTIWKVGESERVVRKH
ncbi:MAG: pyridoxamine 5'-phosphate oxidase family protein [Microthrixaceae bacterium]